MQPWKVGASLTTAVAAMVVLLIGSRLEYLALFGRVILADYGVSVATHMGLALVTVAAILYGAERAVSLADVGRKVDLAELPVVASDRAASQPLYSIKPRRRLAKNEKRPMEKRASREPWKTLRVCHLRILMNSNADSYPFRTLIPIFFERRF